MDRARLRYGWGYETSDFRLYGQDGERAGDPTDYLGYRWYRYKVREALNSKWARSITEDKWIFYRLLDSFGLPAPTTLGLVDPIYGTTWDLRRPLRTTADLRAELDRLQPEGVVLKPNGGSQGRNLIALESIDHATGRAVSRSDGETTLDAALQTMATAGDLGGFPGYVVQDVVRNHPVLDEVAPYATDTVRVQTYLSSTGEVHVIGAVLRLARAGSAVDNLSQGGVAVQVDATTGVTGRGMSKYAAGPLSRHPDSGVELAGIHLPCWDDVLAVVRRAAPCFTGLRSIGWDIAISKTGPVILEGNNNWDLQLLQANTDGFLADPRFREWMADAGAPLPSGNVLEGFVGRWLWPVLARVRR